MSPYIHVEKAAGIEWEKRPRGWLVTIRREPESYYVENPAYYANTALPCGYSYSVTDFWSPLFGFGCH